MHNAYRSYNCIGFLNGRIDKFWLSAPLQKGNLSLCY